MARLPVQVNLGGILAWEFLLMHWVEVRRWQDIRKPGSVNEVSALACYHHRLHSSGAEQRMLTASCHIRFEICAHPASPLQQGLTLAWELR